ncbi:Chitinase domain-containing protein 1 [Balamuthia mandrillaris]
MQQVPSALERGLVKEAPTYKSILKEHKRPCTEEQCRAKRLPQVPTLAYVTPWNSHGYEIAKTFSSKFTYVCPVWYQVRVDRVEKRLFLTGTHDVDEGWVMEVKGVNGTGPAIVPRFLLDGWIVEEYSLLIWDEGFASDFVTLLVRECVKRNYDGLVLEHNLVTNEKLAPVIITLANQLHEQGKKLILVIPADKGFREGQHGLSSSLFAWLGDYVDHFSLMTYDFSSPQRPGPTAPLSWVTQNILQLLPPDHKNSAQNLASKILMGVAFYGYDYWSPAKGEAVVASAYLKTLASYKPKMVWSHAHHEHSFTYNKNGEEHTVYFPTLKSLADRLELAAEMGVGVAIWEIGQGLDYFYDLL